MTLVLELSWSAAATTVRVRDTAAHNIVTEAAAPHPPADHDHRQDPDTWWTSTVAATADALEALVAMGPGADDISMVLVGEGDPPGGLVALDEHHEVLGRAILGSHEASAADADWLVGHATGGSDTWHEATGALPGAGSTVALLSWLHRSDAATWDQLRHLNLPTGWLVQRLTGDHHLSVRDAVGSGVLDGRTGRRWRTDLLEVVDGDRDWNMVLPTLVVPADAAGGLTAHAASDLGLTPVLPVHVGGGLPTP